MLKVNSPNIVKIKGISILNSKIKGKIAINILMEKLEITLRQLGSNTSM